MAIKVEVFSTSTCPHCPAAIDAAEKAKDKLGEAIDVESVKIDDPAQPETRQGLLTIKSWQCQLLSLMVK